MDRILEFTLKNNLSKDPDQWHLERNHITAIVYQALGLDKHDSLIQYYEKLLNESGVVQIEKDGFFNLNEEVKRLVYSGGFINLCTRTSYLELQKQRDNELDREVKQIGIKLGRIELTQRKERWQWLIAAAIVSAFVSAIFRLVFG